MAAPRVTLDQWRSLAAIVERGGYGQAALFLNKSQSAVSYAVQKLEQSLNAQVFQTKGRRAVLTTSGELLYRRARALLDDAAAAEDAALQLAHGWQSEVRLAAEMIFPPQVLIESLKLFAEEYPFTRVELHESVLGGTGELLTTRKVDLAISPEILPDCAVEALLRTPLAPMVRFDHPLALLDRKVALRDLRNHNHIVVRDSGSKRDDITRSVEVERRWTVTQMSTCIDAICAGHGFAWLPVSHVRSQIEAGLLRILEMEGGADVYPQFYLLTRDREIAGTGTLRLAEILRIVSDRYANEGLDDRRPGKV